MNNIKRALISAISTNRTISPTYKETTVRGQLPHYNSTNKQFWKEREDEQKADKSKYINRVTVWNALYTREGTIPVFKEILI